MLGNEEPVKVTDTKVLQRTADPPSLCFSLEATKVMPVIVLILMVARSPNLLLAPRMWAEEASYFFPHLSGQSPFYVISFVYRENYQLLTNISVYISTKIPLVYAAYATTYFALSAQLISAGFLGAFIDANRISRILILPIACVFALLPQGYEIYETATNLQWVCCGSILFLLATPIGDISLIRRRLLYCWVWACGLTGVPSCVLAVAFIVLGIHNRQKTQLNIGLILAVCAVVQLTIIATHAAPAARHFDGHLSDLTIPGLLQTGLSPFLGVDIVQAIASRLNVDPIQRPALVFSVGIAALSVLALVLRVAWSVKQARSVAVVIGFHCVAVTIFNTFGSIGNNSLLISGLHNGRYFSFGILCILILISIATCSKDMTSRQISLYCVYMFAIICVGELILSPWHWLIYNSGPAWSVGVTACQGKYPCVVPISPPGWSAILNGR